VPGWHAKASELVKSGKLKVAGIVQEQHPDRARLYMQWEEMDWPVLADSYNELGIKVVPITLLIDESGVIRFKNPKAADLESFLQTHYPKGSLPKKIPAREFEVGDLKKQGAEEPENAVAHFQLGVAYRKRYDSGKSGGDDFAKAIASWRKALELNPDQYIWRRRIQQYGPRLDKPYSFYDWVNQAQSEITARGGIPHPLTAEPSGSEFADPGNGKEATLEKVPHPDPEGKVTSDEEGLVAIQAVVVPSTKGDGKSVRVHLEFSPQNELEVHWTNDAGNLSFFPESDGVEILDQQGPGEVPPMPSTAETRKGEFEVRPLAGKTLPKEIKATAFYFVCEGVDGVCRYLRQEVTISLDPEGS